ncbi:MAG: bifunctional serine/threonine-protein kinase/formylglycine-generating enzyme family protein [Bacteroidales bacterium]|nr:bifunctional serine/threonine-protein kinase/formylglycine-generating enzyme family protein [Bacteroidales bacterium]
MILKQGTTLERGKYRIDGVLGQGGFGITYLGEQIYLGRKVAIKEFFMDGICVRDDATQAVTAPADTNRGLVERFRRKFIKEAQNIARLKHRGIVPIIDIFEENGTAYYVMEHLPGGSLAGKVKQGALPEREALRYIGQVAAALEYVHSQRIMHLDVKPANILLDEDDNAVLIDFGLAKQYDSTGHQTSTTPVGISHGYAPLEQYKQGGVEQFTPATDVYSLGATLYKLVTGNTPPEASDVINQGLPAFPPSVSPAVQKAITAAMQPAVKARPQSVGEFMRLVESGKIKVESGESTVISSDSEKSARLDNGNASEASPFAKEEILPPYGHRNDEPAGGVISSDSEKSQNNSSFGKKLITIVAVAIPILIIIALFFGVKSCNETDRESVAYVDETMRQQPVRTFTVKGVSFKMIAVEGGTFQMGATAEQQSNRDDEKPVHSVTLDSYYIGETEVTQELWRAVMGSNPSEFSGDDLRPVENVSWNYCQNFIKELNKLTGKNFRLPTEAEWEFAARGGNSSSGYCYSGSSNIGDVAWYGDISDSNTHPVKGKNPNELGIYDMSGNVWEWCSDWYSGGYYNSSPQNNPEGPSSGSHRVLRGGGCNTIAEYCRVASRYNCHPDYIFDAFGLRLAL